MDARRGERHGNKGGLPQEKEASSCCPRIPGREVPVAVRSGNRLILLLIPMVEMSILAKPAFNIKSLRSPAGWTGSLAFLS